ncbi:GNAT family N-acetyltransferase [Cellulomonas rhizosphaerae]|uniref:GNAT family N-acetyltransferase n=1 Tax=Cellulomonas rhizosphaerae TaxID=2293719 RepID=UPI001F236BC3|nr:GNAT family N-acetyltransferase [Cellulomonas rhizosphaerae]
MVVELRLATVADAEDIGRFQTRSWDQTYRGTVPDAYLDATAWQLRASRWHSRIVGDRVVWLARHRGDVVGVASTASTDVARGDLPALELASIYVDASQHGSGLAAELLEAAIGDAPAHLWVFTSNLRAQRFYAKHRFVATDEHQSDPDTGLGETRWVRR